MAAPKRNIVVFSGVPDAKRLAPLKKQIYSRQVAAQRPGGDFANGTSEKNTVSKVVAPEQEQGSGSYHLCLTERNINVRAYCTGKQKQLMRFILYFKLVIVAGSVPDFFVAHNYLALGIKYGKAFR